MMQRTVSMVLLDGSSIPSLPLPSIAVVSNSQEAVSSAGGGSNFSGDANVGLGILAALNEVSVGAIVRSVNHHHHQPAAAAHHHSPHQHGWVSVGGAGLNAPPHLLKSHHERRPLFLESCFLCKRDISHGRDIYMYRGDRAFCSVECRQQQILNDERAERRPKCAQAALKQKSRAVNQRAKVAPATTAAAA